MPNRCPFPRSRLPRSAAAVLGALILATAWPAPRAAAQPAAAAALKREPEIARDEARLLVPGAEAQAPLSERLEMAPGAQRKRLADLRQALNPAMRSQALMRINALDGYLDYDEQDQVVYGPGRTRINYLDFTLEADRVLLDSRLQEVQAEGNVELQVRGNTVQAQSMRYNFDQKEGVAFNARGQYGPVFFRTAPQAAEEGKLPAPQFQMLSEHEAVFKKTDVTTCDFKVPHYFVRGREVVLFPKDRVFFRGATFYAMGVPVFYLPVYSRSLLESSPWSLSLGYNSRTGARVRLGYTYKHRSQEPSLEDDKKLVTRSAGRADIYADYLSKIGPGLGFDYRYGFDFDRHKGELSIYGVGDGDREVFDATPPSDPSQGPTDRSDERWRVLWLHRTEITKDLTLLFNIDEFSDPDIFYDVLDLFSGNEDERNREIERRARTALTLVREAYVIRLMAEVKDRIGLNRLYDFSNPADNDRDYDLDPFNSLDDHDPDGIGGHRWGRVASKLPQLDAATRWLPFGRKAWFYRSELHLYNSLDKALNLVDDRDDAYVQGGELYQELMRQWRLSERYTLLGRVGLGVGGADRTKELGYDIDEMGFPLVAGQSYPRQVDGLTFVDHDTFLIGKRRKSLDDLNPTYFWGDAELQLNARFSDALRGWLRWRLRETTGDFIGDWYASLGSRTVREDLFNYKLRQHWLEGRLDYALFRPLFSAYTGFGVNLEGSGNLYPQEPKAYWNVGARWANLRQTLVLDGNVGVLRRQIFDVTDPRAFEQTEWGFNQSLTYSPIHQRWYLTLDNSLSLTQNAQSSSNVDERLTFFSDQDTNGHFRVIYGRELGPKWNTEFDVAWDYETSGIDRIRWLLERDLHDAIAVLEVRVQTDERDQKSRNDSAGNQIDVRTGLKFKLPGQEIAFGPGRIRTLRQQAREPAVSY